jgi:hypothetical protein
LLSYESRNVDNYKNKISEDDRVYCKWSEIFSIGWVKKRKVVVKVVVKVVKNVHKITLSKMRFLTDWIKNISRNDWK